MFDTAVFFFWWGDDTYYFLTLPQMYDGASVTEKNIIYTTVFGGG